MVGLPHDLQYCLDSMMELHEITGDIYEYFFSIKENSTEFLDNHGVHKNVLMNDYMGWRKTTTPIKKAYLTLSAIESLKHQKHDYMMAVTNDAIITNKRKPTQKMLANSMFVGTTQERFIENLERILKQAKTDFSVVSVDEVLDYRQLIFDQRREFYERLHPWDVEERSLVFKDTTRKLDWKEKKRIKKQRKVVVKSTQLMQSFFNKEDTKLFLGKNFVSISGNNFDFRIKAKELSALDHGSLSIEVYDKERHFLTKLCFYYENMPAPDQITAFLLDVKSGNEDEILKVGNCFSMSEYGNSNQHLSKILEKRKPNPIAVAAEAGDLGFMIDNHLERMLPGSSLVSKFHSATMPIAEKVINKVLKTKFETLNNLLNNYTPLMIEGNVCTN